MGCALSSSSAMLLCGEVCWENAPKVKPGVRFRSGWLMVKLVWGSQIGSDSKPFLHFLRRVMVDDVVCYSSETTFWLAAQVPFWACNQPKTVRSFACVRGFYFILGVEKAGGLVEFFFLIDNFSNNKKSVRALRIFCPVGPQDWELPMWRHSSSSNWIRQVHMTVFFPFTFFLSFLVWASQNPIDPKQTYRMNIKVTKGIIDDYYTLSGFTVERNRCTDF